MSDYQMTIHTRKGVIGHFTIEITGPNGLRIVRGFEPESDKDRMASATLTPVEGLVNDGLKELDDHRSDYKSSKPIPLSKEQYEKVGHFFEEADKDDSDTNKIGRAHV